MLNDKERAELQVWATAVLPRAVAYARSLVRDPSQADDLVQECLFRLLRKADVYDLPRDGVKLLFTAISNLCINETTRRRTVTALDAEEGIPEPVDPSTIPPEQTLEAAETKEALDRALAELPSLHRAALELRALGMGKEKIAEILQVSPANAAVMVHRARKALAAALKLPFFEPNEKGL